MKKITILLLCTMVFVGCKKKDNPYLSIDQTMFHFDKDGRTTYDKLIVESNTAWQIGGIESWLIFSEDGGYGDAIITVAANGINPKDVDQEAIIRVKSLNIQVGAKEIVITQEASDTYLGIDKTILSFNRDGTTAENTFEITSNTDWEISGVESWFTLSQKSGSGDAIITIAIPDPDPDDDEKNTTITIKSLNDQTKVEEVKIHKQ